MNCRSPFLFGDMKKALVVIGVVLVGLYVGVGWFFANLVIDSPTSELRPLDEYVAEEIPDIQFEDVIQASVESADTTQIATTLFDNAADGDCAVIFLHGYTGHRYSQLEYIPMFWERGCDAVVYDARGHGESDDAFHTFGFYEKEDANAVIEWVMETRGLSAEQIGLMGSSYGAAGALQTLFLRDDLAFIIADSSYQDMETIVVHQGQQQFGDVVNPFVPMAVAIAELRANMEFDDVSPQDAVVGKETPLLLLHIRDDAYTPALHSQVIANAASSPELVITAWAERHGTPFHGNQEGYEEIIALFLEMSVPTFR